MNSASVCLVTRDVRNDSEHQWAKSEFGSAQLGDARRTARLVQVASSAARRPDGNVTTVFRGGGPLHGAYDFLENKHVSSEAMTSAMCDSTARRAAESGSSVLVVVDGSSLTLADQSRTKKGLGAIGATSRASRGLKVLTAYGVEANGTPVGVLDQLWWVRKGRKKRSRQERANLPVSQKETRYWLQAIETASARCAAAGVAPWFLIDAEGDSRAMLGKLRELDARYTVRGTWDRVVRTANGEERHLNQVLREVPLLGRYELWVPAAYRRTERMAEMQLRTMRVAVRFADRERNREVWWEMTIVCALESAATTPPGEKPIRWALYTHAQVRSFNDAMAIVRSYSTRWRIEELHRTWKSDCGVERTQLRSAGAIIRWATILVAVAAKSERLKYLARNDPNQPATALLEREELHVLALLSRETTKKSETPPSSDMTIGEAVFWIARLGGHFDNQTKRPPGSVVVTRGLVRLEMAVLGYRASLDDPERRGQR